MWLESLKAESLYSKNLRKKKKKSAILLWCVSILFFFFWWVSILTTICVGEKGSGFQKETLIPKFVIPPQLLIFLIVLILYAQSPIGKCFFGFLLVAMRFSLFHGKNKNNSLFKFLLLSLHAFLLCHRLDGHESGRWGWTGKPGMLQPMRSQRVGQDLVTELN